MLFTTIDLQQDGRITKPELFILFKRIWDNPGLTPFQLAGIYQVGQMGQNMYQANMPSYFGQGQQGPPPQQYGYNQYGGNQQYGPNQQYGQPQYGGQQYGGQQYGQNPYGQYGNQQNWGGK